MKLRYFYLLTAISILTISCKDKAATITTTQGKDILELSKDSVDKKLNASTKMVRDTSKYYIYFSLDDGPQPPSTQICKEILEENDAKATFFMVGLHDSGTKNEKMVESLNNNPLFIVANHSDTHAFRNKYKAFYKNPNGAILDFLAAEKKLNLKHKIARLPGMNTWAIDKNIKGFSSSHNVARKLDSLGYSVFGWDLEWDFVHGNVPVESATHMINAVDKVLKSGKTYQPKSIVILAHDRMFGKPQYADSLRKFISTLKKNDQYVFETLDNYPILTPTL